MKNFILFFYITLSVQLLAQHPSIDPNYEIIFEDNFDDFNTSTWQIYPKDANTILTPPYSNHPWNTPGSEKPYITTDRPENVYAAEGILHQVFRKENYMGKEFTNSHIQSKNLYGPNIYIEAKVKLPHQNPLLLQDRIKQAAFWMYKGGPCLESSYFGYREIDILEWQSNTRHDYHNLNGDPNDHGASTGNLHYCGYDNCLQTSPSNLNNGLALNNPYSTDPCRALQEYIYLIPNQSDWHSVAAYWERDNVSLLLDDIWHNTRNTTTPLNANNPMRKDMYIINGLNVNVGAVEIRDEEGQQTLLERFKNEENLFPFEYLTDYIRIWQLKKDCNTIVFDIPNFSTYQYALKKSITLSEETVVPITTDVISLRATDFIEFLNGFEVLDEREISFNTNECPN